MVHLNEQIDILKEILVTSIWNNETFWNILKKYQISVLQMIHAFLHLKYFSNGSIFMPSFWPYESVKFFVVTYFSTQWCIKTSNQILSSIAVNIFVLVKWIPFCFKENLGDWFDIRKIVTIHYNNSYKIMSHMNSDCLSISSNRITQCLFSKIVVKWFFKVLIV